MGDRRKILRGRKERKKNKNEQNRQKEKEEKTSNITIKLPISCVFSAMFLNDHRVSVCMSMSLSLHNSE